jgi:large subunit ribosomal protein L4
VLTRDEELSERVVRNIETVHVLPVDQLNAYDVLVSDDIVFSKAALEAFISTKLDAGIAGAKQAKKEEVSA